LRESPGIGVNVEVKESGSMNLGKKNRFEAGFNTLRRLKEIYPDRPCGLVVTEFLAANPEVLGSIPGTTRFSEN
jgi:hypothetical protein